MEETKVKWVRWSTNEAAHGLAKEGCLHELIKTWFSLPLGCIFNVLNLDIPVVVELNKAAIIPTHK